MSLINDALKKAQKQRTGEAPPLASLPSVGGQSAAAISRRSKPSGLDSLVLRAGLSAAVVLILGIGGWFAFRPSPEAKRSAVSAQPSALSANPQTSGLKPQASEPQPAAAPAFTLPAAPKPEPVVVPASSLAAKRPDEPSVALAKEGRPSPQTSAVSAPVPASAPPAVALKLEPRAMTFIDNLKVAGIRASATDSKVLMNDRVYRLGDIVEHEMGLKLVGITGNSLTFEDEKGGRYTRTF
jgi:hypothetical protein